MFYSVDGKIISVDNKFTEMRLRYLTFQTKDEEFPKLNSTNFPVLTFESSIPQNVIVYWPDGLIDNYEMTLVDGVYVLQFQNTKGNTALESYAIPEHIFTDTQNNGTLRNVVFEFERLEKVFIIDSRRVNLYGDYPKELGLIRDLREIALNASLFLTSFPESVQRLRKLESISFVRSFAGSKFIKIPDGFFNNPLRSLSLNFTYDLSDPIASNFFKINQLSTTLKSLLAEGCSIIFLPNEIQDLLILDKLRISNNPIRNPEVIESLTNLTDLYISSDNDYVDYLLDTTNFSLVRSYWRTSSLTENMINEIPTKWSGFRSLGNVIGFGISTITTELQNIFIDKMYDLVTQNGFLDRDSTEAQATGFPNQFRNINWRDSNNLVIDSIVEEPPSFILGVSNGNPTTRGQKIYVLVYNYNHTITTA